MPTYKSQLRSWVRSLNGAEFTLRQAADAYQSFGGVPDWVSVARVLVDYQRDPFVCKRLKDGPRGGRWSYDTVWRYDQQLTDEARARRLSQQIVQRGPA